MSPYSCLAIPFQTLAVKLDIVYMDLPRLVTITVNELTNIQILSKKEVNREMITETESQEVEFKLIQMDWLIFYLRCPR